jgi:hypothetical protein
MAKWSKPEVKDITPTQAPHERLKNEMDRISNSRLTKDEILEQSSKAIRDYTKGRKRDN